VSPYSKLCFSRWVGCRHKDGWQYRHFLDSPEQGLLLCYFYDDVLPQSGGTQIALDSIEIAARFFAEHPEGVHPDLAQGAVLNPFLQQVEGQGRFEELTGEAGDLAIIHPCASYIRCACSVCCLVCTVAAAHILWCDCADMMHRSAPNHSGRARFAQFPNVFLKRPMDFSECPLRMRVSHYFQIGSAPAR
jgi:hypothetical protein